MGALSDGELACIFDLEMPDGETVRFSLVIRSGLDGRIKVREAQPERLPPFCPERHINPDGTFCLGFDDEVALKPQTPEQAATWWATLRGFLVLQQLAAATGEWHATAWPHGDGAVHQREFERLIERIPPSVRDAGLVLTADRQAVRDHGRRCPCLSGKSLRRCHEKDLIRLDSLRRKRRDAERAYLASVRDNLCCGSMRDCPLKLQR